MTCHQNLIARLNTAITTEINDDETKPHTPLKDRHLQRVFAMQDARDALEDKDAQMVKDIEDALPARRAATRSASREGASDPAPATDEREGLVEAEAVFRKIREYAENIAFSAGAGESEIAGQIVSFLVDRPELLRDFMAGTLSAIDTGMLDHHNGVLSYWGMDGEVHRPDPRQARFPARRAALSREEGR